MTKTLSALLFATLLSTPATLLAGGRGDAILGGALGGAFGAAIGSEMGGRDGAIVGGAIGGATGAALATHRRHRHYRSDYGPSRSYYYRPDPYRGHYPHYHDWE